MITKEQCKIVFMGTPDFAIPSLNMLVEEGYRVEAVFTQPDRPRGRGHKRRSSTGFRYINMKR